MTRTPEEIEVARRNLAAQLRHDLRKADLSVYPVDVATMLELVEVLEDVRAVPTRGQIEQTVTDHPSEPVGVSDEAVEAAARVDRVGRVGYDDWETAPVIAQQALRKNARAMLEAAKPLMGATPRPALDRSAVRTEVIRVIDDSMDKGALSPDGVVAAVMALVRSLPTREQVALWLYKRFGVFMEPLDLTEAGPDWPDLSEDLKAWWVNEADAVLALLDGTEDPK